MTTEPTAKHQEEAREKMPCPFCGHDIIEVAGDEWQEDWRATCIGCLARSGRYRTRPEALKAWNTRALSSRDREIREVLEGLRDDDCFDACFLRWMKRYEDSDGFEHSPACLATRVLWEKVQG